MREFGVLFLHTSLSSSTDDSELQKQHHASLWKNFIKDIIEDILSVRDCIFVCLGADGKAFTQHIQFRS